MQRLGSLAGGLPDMTRTFPSASFNGPYFGKVTASEYVDPEDTSTKRWKYTLEIVELAENGWCPYGPDRMII